MRVVDGGDGGMMLCRGEERVVAGWVSLLLSKILARDHADD